jgi:hypothetical protein
LRGSEDGGQPGASSSQDPISKITSKKCVGGVAQVIEHLLYKHKAHIKVSTRAIQWGKEEKSYKLGGKL